MATVQASGSTQDTLATLGQSTRTKASETDEMQDRFLTLLVSQIRNQDPLNPMDNAQFTSQLAQISTVSSIDQLNKTMQQLVGYYDEGRAMQAAAMVGKYVLVGGNELQLGADGVVGGVELARGADDINVTISDSNNLVMRTLTLGSREAGSHVFAWDGLTDSGTPAVPGNYSFSIEAKQGGEAQAASPLQFGMVNAIVRDGSGFSLDLGDLGTRSFDAVRRII